MTGGEPWNMKDNEEISKLRNKLKSSRNGGEESSIESRLYGSRDDEKPGTKKDKVPVERKVRDFSSSKQQVGDDDAEKSGPRILADYTKEGNVEHPDENLTEQPEGADIPDQKAKASEGRSSSGAPVEPKKRKNSELGMKFKAFFKTLKYNISSMPKRILMPAALFLLLFSALLWYVFTDASDLKEINISGNEIISTEEIENRLDFEPGDKMFSINTATAEENISLLPIIVDVDVEREWWNGVNVDISEYRAVGYVENEGSYNPLLENARILRGYQATPASGPLIHHFEGEEMDRLVDNLNDMEPEILAGISEIYYRPSENSMTRIHIFMNDGQEIVADYRDFGEKMNHYIGMKEEIGAEGAGIIDIEIGSSFLPYGSSEAEQIKEGIYNSPEASGYVNEINASMNTVKETLNEFDNIEDE